MCKNFKLNSDKRNVHVKSTHYTSRRQRLERAIHGQGCTTAPLKIQNPPRSKSVPIMSRARPPSNQTTRPGTVATLALTPCPSECISVRLPPLTKSDRKVRQDRKFTTPIEHLQPSVKITDLLENLKWGISPIQMENLSLL